jgi:uncharacterized membrane protein
MKKGMNVNMSTKNLVVIALFIAITFILANTPIGVISLPTIAFTISHIPAIIISIVAGPIAGAIVGGFFGLMMMFRAMTRPTGILDPYFINPLVSVLPRILLGITPYYTYKAMRKINENLAIMVGAGIGSLTNTIGVMGILYAIYFQSIVQAFDEVGASAIGVLLTIIFVYGTIEMVAAIVITYLVVATLKRVKAI